ncbi:MAG: 7TM diverse intracellular signaling domain-containing protein [Ferruginibacter sp.]
MKHLTVLVFLFSTAFSAMGQTGTKCLNTASFTDSAYITNCVAFTDSVFDISPEQALQHRWYSLAELGVKKFLGKKWVTKKCWLKFSACNTTDSTAEVFFFPGISFSEIKTFIIDSAGRPTLLPDKSQRDGCQPLQLKPGEEKTFLVSLRFTRSTFNRLMPQLIKKDYLLKYQKSLHYTNALFLSMGYLFSGIIIMMAFFSIANFFLSKRREFLYYSCYAACIFLLIFLSTYTDKHAGVAVSMFIGYFAFSLLAIGTIFYVAFTRKFLNTKTNFPSLHKLFVSAERIFIMLWIAFTCLHFFTNNYELQRLTENTFKIMALVLGAVYIVSALVQKNRFLTYIALGNGILIFLSTVSLITLLFPLKDNSIFARSIIYYEVGVAGELMFFLIGLSYKNRIDLIERTKMQEALKREGEKANYETKLAILDAQQKERNRISADMHDDLGSGITAIRLYSELAKTRMGNTAVPEIEKISSSANELLNNMNAIIWTMNSSNDTLENMVAYIRNYSQEYFEGTGINCKFTIEDKLPEMPVSGKIRRNVFLVIKETLNNIIKHSKATQVNIKFSTAEDGLTLVIHDNGVGIDMNNLRRFGNGLTNMKKRMEEMNIAFSIENKNGTLVTLYYAIVS